MSRVAPAFSQVVPGQFITSALWNAQVVSAGAWLLGSGTDGPPRFKAYQSSAQSISTGVTYVSVLLDTEVFDSDGGHSTVTNTSRYTVQVAGLYLCQATAAFPSMPSGNTQASTGMRSVRVAVNGTVATGAGAVVEGPPATNNSSWVAQAFTIQYLNVGDFVENQVWQSSGGDYAMSTGSNAPSLACFWLSN